MASAWKAVALYLGLCVAAAADNADLIFPPPASKGSDLPEKLMVLIPGANVATEHYSTTVQGGSITDQLRGGGVVLRRSRGALVVVQVARCLASFSKIPRGEDEDPARLSCLVDRAWSGLVF
jgi:hypothetical protein